MIKTDQQPDRRHDLALICGDGMTLPQELQMFGTVGVKHDAFCVGRALQCYIPYVAWKPATINYIWLDEQMFTYARDQVDDYVTKHSVFFDPKLRSAIDVLWTDPDGGEVVTWQGSSGLFALQVAVKMGYERILLAGVPINAEPHWYDPENYGPAWNPETLVAWRRFWRQTKNKDTIRSCSGYTQYLFGEPTIGWLRGQGKQIDAGANRRQAGGG